MSIIDTALPNQEEETGVVGAPIETPVAETEAPDVDALGEALGLGDDVHQRCDCPECRANRESETSISDDMKEVALANLPKTQLAAVCLEAYRAGHLDYTETVRSAQFEATDITYHNPPVLTSDNTPEKWVVGMCNILSMLMGDEQRLFEGKVVRQVGGTTVVYYDLSNQAVANLVTETENGFVSNCFALLRKNTDILFTPTELVIDGVKVFSFNPALDTLDINMKDLASSLAVMLPVQFHMVNKSMISIYRNYVTKGLVVVDDAGFQWNSDHKFYPYVRHLETIGGDAEKFQKIRNTLVAWRGVVSSDTNYTFGDIEDLEDFLLDVHHSGVDLRDGVFRVLVGNSKTGKVPVGIPAAVYQQAVIPDHNNQLRNISGAVAEEHDLDPVLHDMFKADAQPLKYPEEERSHGGMPDFASMLRGLR